MLESIRSAQVLDLVLFQALLLLNLISNAVLLYRARRHAQPDRFPTVSILVPARNEEQDIRACIDSLLAQDYPDFEVLALDDHSSDGTLAILEQIAAVHPRLSVFSGAPSADGQTGKNWACAQLARQARGELLLFTDADTLHQPQTLCAVVTALLGEQADLLSGFPRQQTISWGERLLVPFFAWASLAFTPLWLAYRLRFPALSSAVGQMMLFRRSAYEAVGGHGQLGAAVVDDLTLARRIKAAGLRWRMASISDLITCRMYADSREAVDGFVKNYFPAFGCRLLPYVFVFAWLLVLFWRPLILLMMAALGRVPQNALPGLLVCIALALLLWLIAYRVQRLPAALALLYPLTILANAAVAMESLRLSLTGRARWKDREISKARWRWL